MSDTDAPPPDENQIIAERRAKLAALRVQGQAFPNDFRRDALAAELHSDHGAKDNTALEPAATRVAGRHARCSGLKPTSRPGRCRSCSA